jgi:hypothetical protein
VGSYARLDILSSEAGDVGATGSLPGSSRIPRSVSDPMPSRACPRDWAYQTMHRLDRVSNGW